MRGALLLLARTMVRLASRIADDATPCEAKQDQAKTWTISTCRGVIHGVPDGDACGHRLSVRCECEPVITSGVAWHNSWDGREPEVLRPRTRN